MAGLVFTWPLAVNFFSAIPYTLRPQSGFERFPLIPGDHLQTYYWFWLLSDNLWGTSLPFSNPYEFNGPHGPMSQVYANFPFSILYLLFLPLGPIGAYNALILLSFLLSGLAAFLLSRSWTKDPWAALLAALVFAVAPYRISHIAGGQLYGYIIFLLPLCLYFIEQSIQKGRWAYSGAAGCCLIVLALMESHATFLTVLTLGIYLPSRFLLFEPYAHGPLQKSDNESPGRGFIEALTGGVAISLFIWMMLSRRSGLPFWDLRIIQPLVLGTLASLLVWFYFSALLWRWTRFSLAEAQNRVGKRFLFFLPLLLYGVTYWVTIPHGGALIFFLCLGCFGATIILSWIRHRSGYGIGNKRTWIKVAVGLGSGLAIAVVYLIHVRTTIYLPSLAGKGRTLGEVLLYSPKLSNFFFWLDINNERFVLIGWGLPLLAVLGLLTLFRKKEKIPGYPVLAAVLAFLALLLTLGPNLPFFPLYRFLYDYFPFFNYPRVPGRFVIVGILSLSLLAGLALAAFRSWLDEKGCPRLKQGIPFLILLVILSEYHTYGPIGLSLMGGNPGLYRDISQYLPAGRRILELPIWPGDSHQSSVYEYTVTQTRRPMVNGYAPVVFRDYIQQVFWPLYTLDHGELKASQHLELKKLGVDLITFHDNDQLYTSKISPFPPRLTLKRLNASPWLEPLTSHGQVSLFKLLDGAKIRDDATNVTSPVQAIFYARDLHHQTGKRRFDPSASGFYLLLQEGPVTEGKNIPKPGAEGNLIQALPGHDQPGHLINGPSRFLPSGSYVASFRLKAAATDARQEVGHIEIIRDYDRKVLADKILQGKHFEKDGQWVDVPLSFGLSSATKVGFGVYFSGTVPLSVNLVSVRFAEQPTGPGGVEAEDLFRQTGQVIQDPLASGGEAVFAQAGHHPPIYLVHGPYRTLEPGRYRIRFLVRLGKQVALSSEKPVALLEVATDMGKHLFKKRWVGMQEVRFENYSPVEMDFEVPFRCEVDYRFKFLGQTDLLVDRIEMIALEKAND